MTTLALAPVRHPFLARLPEHVRVPLEEKVAAITVADLRHFVLAYCACFVAATTYFA